MYQCDICEDTGWVDDETACGDPDHCCPIKACVCNPEFLDDPYAEKTTP